ncbi:MAG TPA: nucleotidyltransferase family protein, partial [Actinomycetota bacterium]|nr:nucleotidyltransferase family protein [Actinomycetota bacterium]
MREHLTTRTIRFLVLKGIPLAKSLGNSLSDRLIGDNDILVRKADAHRALRALSELGYARALPYSLRSALKSEWQYPLIRITPERVFHVDLHWSPFSDRLYNSDEDFIWKHMVTDAGGFLVLDEPMTAVQLAAHMASHRFAEERVLRDFKAAWGRLDASQRSKSFEMAQCLGLAPTLDYVLLLSGDETLRNQSVRARLVFRASPRVRTTDNIQLDYLGR